MQIKEPPALKIWFACSLGTLTAQCLIEFNSYPFRMNFEADAMLVARYLIEDNKEDLIRLDT